MIRVLLLAAVACLALCGRVAAQESVILKTLLDNERVHVFQADFKPGDKLPTRNYPNHLIYTLTAGTLVFGPAGRTAYEVNFKAGEAMWFPPLARATENDSDKEVRLLLVEFKEAAASSRAAKGKTRGKSRGKAKPAARGKAKPAARGKGAAKK